MASRATFWQGKSVLITGASSGIGDALARLVAKRGARVGLIARRESLLAGIAHDIRASGGMAEFRIADVSRADEIATVAAELQQVLGPCDVAIASAGIFRATLVEKLDAAAIADVMNTNVLGVSNLFAAVLPGMVSQRRGHLAAVASLAGYLGLQQSGAYCASKAAVITLLKSLRLDLAPHGVSVTTISPGFVDTAMITEEERKTVRGLLTAEDTARRIALAVERGRAEVAFPWGLGLQARTAGLLPWWLYRLVVGGVPPLEEVPPPS
jgi:short-subunit dehydrogenase